MKKLLTILTISAIALTSLVAKSAEVQLVNTIDETPVSYQLDYNGYILDDGIDKYAIEVAPLTEDGSTEDFSVHATSNMNSDMAISVFVSPESFKTTLNDGSEAFDSQITPSVNTSTKIDTLLAGKHDSLLVNRFNLSWDGNSELPAGDYVSNVRIEYSIQ